MMLHAISIVKFPRLIQFLTNFTWFFSALIYESYALIRESYALIREKYNFFLYENEPNRLS